MAAPIERFVSSRHVRHDADDRLLFPVDHLLHALVEAFRPRGISTSKCRWPAGDRPPESLPVKLRLTADGAGKLAGVTMGGKPLPAHDPFPALRREMRGLVADDAGPGAADRLEVELDCDARLHYEYVMRTITAVSGYVGRDAQGQRQIVKLIEKVKFARAGRGLRSLVLGCWVCTSMHFVRPKTRDQKPKS